ncbi:MAG TPA: hypothetical protein VN493_23140 [Thermoanaerobaculia bacterium]|nr:hypothetical protein [Thermoanaerobaculia bacterium]
MNADFLVLKIHDEVASLNELREGESKPLGFREQVRKAVGQALPSVRWLEDSRAVWWSGEVFSVEIGLPMDEDPVRSLTLKVRLNPGLGSSGWLSEEEDELENFLLGLCDPNGWILFDLASGRRYQFRDEVEEDEAEATWSEVGPVN